MSSSPDTPLSTLLSQAVIAYTIELDNEFEHRFVQAGGRARIVSLVMWSNFLRFVGDGITVGELPGAAGTSEVSNALDVGRHGAVAIHRRRHRVLRKARRLRERAWAEEHLGRPAHVERPEGGGDLADPLRRHRWRWRGRFGADEIDALESSLRAVVEENDIELPEYLPIVGGANGMVADLVPAERRESPPARVHLCALLARALLLYTLDFERDSALSLPLCANVVRVLEEAGVLVDEIPARSGISKEAASMALTFLVRSGYVAVDGATSATKLARLTSEGRAARDACGSLHAELESRWAAQFGVEALRRLRSSLELVLERRKEARTLLSLGLEPYAGGWRASAPYVTQTRSGHRRPRRGATPLSDGAAPRRLARRQLTQRRSDRRAASTQRRRERTVRRACAEDERACRIDAVTTGER